jgi:hypothetical protein
MHHVALNGARPHNGDFNHQIIEAFGRQTRQHRHLRAAFDLKYADRFGLLDHGVGLGIFGRDRVQVRGASFDNGLLKIELVREVPEAMKPRRIAINGAPANDVGKLTKAA